MNKTCGWLALAKGGWVCGKKVPRVVDLMERKNTTTSVLAKNDNCVGWPEVTETN